MDIKLYFTALLLGAITLECCKYIWQIESTTTPSQEIKQKSKEYFFRLRAVVIRFMFMFF